MGLIGASILKDVRNHAPQIKRYGISKGHEQQIAFSEKLIEGLLTFDKLVNTCDLIFIATPISDVIDVAINIKRLKKTKKLLIVSDVASVKLQISKVFSELNGTSIKFITSHPMGGSEKSGYEGSRGGLFRNKP